MWFLLTFQQLVYDLIIERTTAVNLGKLVRFIHKKIMLADGQEMDSTIG